MLSNIFKLNLYKVFIIINWICAPPKFKIQYITK